MNKQCSDKEIRWFIPDRAVSYLPRRRGRRRTDWYRWDSLGPDAATKLRHGVQLERKQRIGEPWDVEVGGCAGVAEHWVKQRLEVPPGEGVGSGAWICVSKEIWTTPGVSFARVDVGAETPWWTVVVDLDQSRSVSANWAFRRWRPTLRESGVAASFPSWLLGLLDADDVMPTSARPASIDGTAG